MCWQTTFAKLAGGAVDAAKDAIPAAGAVGGVSLAAGAISAPTWLVGLAQAIIVVYFTLRGVDRRQKARDKTLAELSGRVDSLHGRIDGLACAQPRRRATDHPVLTPCPTNGSE